MSTQDNSGSSPTSDVDDPLEPLQALEGDWVSETGAPGGEITRRNISYRWLFGRKFLRAESERITGDKSVRMDITYLWDPAGRMIRAWVIASDGAWSQAEVHVSEGAVALETRGVDAQGVAVEMTSTLTPTAPDTRTETWSNIKIGGKALPGAPPIVWRRK